MGRIKGIKVVLYEKTQTGTDPFNKPIYSETPVSVDNVLVGEPTTNEITDSISLHGRKAQYTLAIPKGDTHNWENAKIEFFGQTWQSFGIPVQGIEENIPLSWNKKVWVSRYE